MTTTEYNNYVASVDSFLKRNKVKPGCYGNEQPNEEPGFSWRACECCGSKLGGSRERYQFATTDAGEFAAEICTDCVYFLAYGQLDDATMAELSDEPTTPGNAALTMLGGR